MFSKLFSASKKEDKPVETDNREAIWIEGFSAGFQSAWNMMAPLMTQGVINMKESIRTEAIEETRKRLEPLIGNKVHKD